MIYFIPVDRYQATSVTCRAELQLQSCLTVLWLTAPQLVASVPPQLKSILIQPNVSFLFRSITPYVNLHCRGLTVSVQRPFLCGPKGRLVVSLKSYLELLWHVPSPQHNHFAQVKMFGAYKVNEKYEAPSVYLQQNGRLFIPPKSMSVCVWSLNVQTLSICNMAPGTDCRHSGPCLWFWEGTPRHVSEAMR